MAIETVLLLAAAFDLPLRQAEGFARSILTLVNLDLPVPDHTTLARRRRTVTLDMHAPGRTAPVDLMLDSTGLKFFGPGEWARLKHDEKRRDWRKLYISVDAGTGEILSHFLTNSDTSDAAMAGPLVETAGGRIRTVIADGAYYGASVAAAIRNARPATSPPKIIIPPPRTAIPPPRTPHGGTERECHVAEIGAYGRIACPSRTEYGKRSLAEAAISCLTSRGRKILRTRTNSAQCREIGSHIAAANKAIRHAKPVTVRVL
ncbi:MAG: IS5 family transposase [Pseudomonadota bacterium]